MFARTIYSGSLDVQSDRADLAGHLDLFGPNPVLSVKGDIIGSIDGSHVDLRGDASVALAGLALTSTHMQLTETRLQLNGRWFDAFAADLKFDGSVGRIFCSGRLSGSIPITIDFPAQYIPTPTGPVKVCDRFTMTSTFALDVHVQVDEISGLNCDGTAVFTVANQRQSVPVRFRAGPSDLDALKRMIVNQVLGNARQMFQTLYPTARDWVTGVTSGAIGWTHTAWNDTASVLRTWFNQSASQVVGLLATGAYGAGEIGRILRAQFTSDPLVLVKAFADAGADVKQAGQAAFEVFEQAFNRDPFTQARSVVAMLHVSYPPAAVATTMRELLNIQNNRWTLQILHEQHYATREIADVARNVCRISAQETATIFVGIGIAANDALDGLNRVYHEAGTRTIAGYLAAAGYGRGALNTALSHLGIPGI
jgi:hypothetical protein